MIATLLATVLASTPVLSDTVVRLGIVERDLTGDNVPETLSLTGRGQTVDSLEVTFTIASSGRTLFETKWSETRAVGFDAGRRVLSATEHRRRLRELGRFFFADEKFMSPAEFLISLRGSAPGHIDLIPDVIARDLHRSDRSRARPRTETFTCVNHSRAPSVRLGQRRRIPPRGSHDPDHDRSGAPTCSWSGSLLASCLRPAPE